MAVLQAKHALAALVLVIGAFGAPGARAQSAPDMYSDETVWDWASQSEALPALCGVESWFDLNPDESVADAGCVQAAMRTLGASESAVRFFETTRQFLASFEERGALDFGVASSPWVNMARGESVLLNGSPSAILMSQVLRPYEDQSWQSIPEYAALLAQYPQVSPWVEYGGPQAEHPLDTGGVLIEAAFDMRECRACPNVATFRVDYRFDPAGYLAEVTVLPPDPPRP